jgi:beta-lactamase regulating signal transducer with metallopeptidase domain
MTPLVRALSSALLHFVWQGALVAIVCWLALWTLRRRSANARYAVACAALALLVVLPAITTWMLYDHPFATHRGAVVLAPLPDLPALPAPAFDWLAGLRAWAVPVWACGVLFFALRMAWGCAQVATLRRRGEDADPSLLKPLAERLGVARPIRLIVSTLAESPAVIGWLRPVILIPAAALAGLPADQLEAILAHELAHVRRHDYLVNLLQMAAESLLFYHPAVWWISARIRHERELCCDDLAAPLCGGAIVYARALTSLEKMRPPETAFALAANSGPLLYRIRRLLLGDVECAPSRLSGLVAVSVAATCVLLSVSWAHAQETTPPSPPKPNVEELRRLALEEQQRRQLVQRQLEEFHQRLRELQWAAAQERDRRQDLRQLQQQRDEVARQLEVERARMMAQMATVNTYNLRLMTLESELKRLVEATGRKLARIDFNDVAEKDADALRIRLPIREGEYFAGDMFNKIQRVVHEVNPDLRVSLGHDGDDLVIVIRPR